MPVWLSNYLSGAHPAFYPSVGVALFLAGVCAPISADLVLLAVGYIAYQGQADPRLLVLISISAILLGDTVMFGIGRKFGRRVLQVWPFRKAFTPERMERAEGEFNRHGYRVVFLARFMPGVRTVFMFTSGTLGLRYLKFILHDLAGALIVVPLMIYSVTWVAGNTELIREKFQQSQWFVVGGVTCIAVFYFLRKRSERL